MCPLDGPLHPLAGWREHDFRAKRLEDLPSLQAHRLRHGQNAPVTLGGRHHRQGNAGIATGRLDNRGAGFNAPLLLGRLDHRQPDTVLDGSQRVAALKLHKDGGLTLDEFADLD